MRGKVKQMMKTGLAAAIAAAGAFVSHGGMTNETVVAELPHIIVEASRTGRTPDEIPALVGVIGRAEIAASGARDFAELVERKASSLNVIKRGHARLLHLSKEGRRCPQAHGVRRQCRSFTRR